MNKLFFLASLLCFLLVSCQPAQGSIRLAVLGDMVLGRGVKPGSSSLAYLTPAMQAADLRLANLESPLAGVPPADGRQSGYNLCASAANAAWLAAWGLDLVSLANNHRFDCGPEGVCETARILTRLGIAPIGSGPQPVTREIRGLKIAFLAFDDILTPLDIPAAMQAIQAARKEGALVVVSIHWGAEYQAGASMRQKTLAGQLAEAGASLIVGTHPHVLQPAEWIATSWGRTLVLYSLGNALFDQGGLQDTRQSALVIVKLERKGVQSVNITPFEMDVVHSRIIKPSAEAGRQIRERLQIP
jgi:poly-gamma-glutamate capsule biosynthesis protein CapA/YwtB (metallophosphatase superfamily)